MCIFIDVCQEGVCVFGVLIGCDDKNLCTLDECVEGTGCVYMLLESMCDDSNFCMEADGC